MAIWATDFLALSLRLRDSDDEAERRTATSRLYYAMLHRAMECLEDSTDFQRPTEKTLFRVREALGYRWRHLESRLTALKDLRERADYEIRWHGDWPVAYRERAEVAAMEVARELDRYGTPTGQQDILPLLEAGIR